MARSRQAEIAAAVAVGVVAVAVRVPGVWSRPFWEDEAASAQILHEPTLWAALRRVVRTESTPPLWYVLAWAIHQLGVPIQDERLLSVLFGGVFAALVVVLARRFVGIALAVLAGLLTALGSEFVKQGYELRSYELFASLAALLGLVLILELDSPSRRREVALALTVAAGGLTHFFFAFLVVAALAWLWLDPGARAIRVRATCAIAAGCAIALTWIPLLLAQYQPWRFSWIGAFRWRPVVAVSVRLFTTAYSGTLEGLILSATGVAVLAVGCVRLSRTSPAGRLLAVLAVAPLGAAAAVWAAGMPIFDLRNQIGVGAFVAVAFVAAVDALPVRAAVVPAGAVVAAMALAVATATPAIRAYNVIARRLVVAGWSASQPIAVFGDPYAYRTPLEWYLPHQPVLTFASPRAASCTNVFLVRPGGVVVPTTLGAARTTRHVTLLLSARADRHCLHKPSSVDRDAPAASTGLPAGWRQVSHGPAGGVVYQGRIVNRFARWDARPSAIYLPPGYTLQSRYPVIYLLAGMRGSPSSYWRGMRFATVADRLIASGRTQPFIAAIPAAGPIANPDRGEWAGIWESYLIQDVVPWVDAHLPTVASRDGRALEGLCAGGFGAVDIGLRHPGLFGTLGSWEGYFAPVFRDGPFVHAKARDLAAHDPSLLVRMNAQRLRSSDVRFYISAGMNHGRVLRDWSLEFAQELQGLHLEHELWLRPAAERGHFWRATLPSALLYAGAGFTPPTTATPLSR